MKFRDRDAPITPEGLIFRTYGYDHPPRSCFCDLEYAPETKYSTDNPRALRDGLQTKYYKFYFDGGIQFALNYVPPYAILHEPLNQIMAGVTECQISSLIRPQNRLQELLKNGFDPLIETTREVLNLITDNSRLTSQDFGVFGSLSHGFHNSRYSDIDLIIYGVQQLKELRFTLSNLYDSRTIRNEFEFWNPKDNLGSWNFIYYNKHEYRKVQKRKLIYAVARSEILGRQVKIEFEPVRQWNEINNEYPEIEKIERLGMVQAIGEVLCCDETGFMPAIYPVKIKSINSDIDPKKITRVVSFIEEFRLQIQSGETALIMGNLERILKNNTEFHQITLSYGNNYFDQVLKPIKMNEVNL